MTAAQGAQARGATQLAPQLVGPGTGRVDDDPGVHFLFPFQQTTGIAHHHTADLPDVCLEQAFHPGVIERQGPPGYRFTDQAQNEAGIIRLGVKKAETSLKGGSGQQGTQFAHILNIVGPVAPLMGHQIIDRQPCPEYPTGHGIPFQARVKETKPIDQPAALFEQVFTFGDRFKRDAYLGVLQITHPTVDKFR